MNLTIPELSLVILVGPTGSGKSSFALKHFRPTEVLSSDFCRGLVSNDPNDQNATNDAFEVLKFIAAKRLSRGLLTVIDATNVQPESRKPLINLARDHDVLPVAIVLNLPEKLCHERNKNRPDRNFGPHVVRQHLQQLRRSLRTLEREGFRYVHVLTTPEEVEQVQIERKPLWNNRKFDHGPFEIIGDIHGCYDELVTLLHKLGHDTTASHTDNPDAGSERSGTPRSEDPDRVSTHENARSDRKIIFLGDLTDRGPKSLEVLRLIMRLVQENRALCIPGNHDVKLLRKLRGKNVEVRHGLELTMAQLNQTDAQERDRIADFLDKLVGHYVLDDGKFVVAHAGIKEEYIGRASRRVREFALYGDTTGETDDLGLPVRNDWAAEYRGSSSIVYGHTPVAQPQWLNRTINIDTGCVFGGKLTALRWPECQLVSVDAKQTYANPGRPFLPDSHIPTFGAPPEGAEVIDRPGAYAIVRDEAGKIAVVQVGSAGFLPGGGADAGESLQQTLAREVFEECGRVIEVEREIGHAIQHVTNKSGTHYAKQCTYFTGRFTQDPPRTPSEPDHELKWMEPTEAIEKLILEADKWALRRALDPKKPAATPRGTPQQDYDDLLDIDDVRGKRIINTRLHHNVTIREENSIAALEVMSRFAANPKWLIYLPPTMSPPRTTEEPGLLEHPRQAFDYFRENGIQKVICEEKHMGSRAVVIICRDEQSARTRFGLAAAATRRNAPEAGIIYTRTGRRFFEDEKLESELLDHVRNALTKADFWKEFETDWFCLDCELMPWSAKAQDLLKNQYAAVGAAARAALPDVAKILKQANARYTATGNNALASLVEQAQAKIDHANRFVEAYRHYCWPVTSVQDLKLAPFHILASEDKVHTDKDHQWHMQTLARLAATAPTTQPSPGLQPRDATTNASQSIITKTQYRIVDLTDPKDSAAGEQWWQNLTAKGGEGMVVKPLEFIARNEKGLLQPAVKCRGPEYLRIIYGPDYDAPQNLTRLRERGLRNKRSLALREFALGIEGLERFVQREPLRKVHECAFGVLALESEPVDPRL